MNSCRVCGGSDLHLFLDLGDQPHCDSFLVSPEQVDPRFPLQVFFCKGCTTVQIGYTIPKEVMFGEFLYLSGTTKTLRDHFQQSARRLTDRLSLGGESLVVDIGSNDGTWISYFKDEGTRVLGVECAANLAELANSRGLPTLQRYFNQEVAQEIIQKHGKAELVTAAGVFFHLEELHSVTAGVADLLAPNGVFCVQAIYLGGMIEKLQFDQIYHEHLTYWRLGSIESLLERYQMEVFSVRPLDIHGGTMEYWVCKKGTRPIDESVESLRQQELSLGLHELAVYQEFATRVFALGKQLRSMLSDLKEKGLTVFAFGAPAKGATLLNSFDIGLDLLECAIEVNPLKIGRYMPGSHLPILEESPQRQPDVYLMLAWNFLKEFMPRYRQFFEGGGRFLVPFPSPYFVSSAQVDP